MTEPQLAELMELSRQQVAAFNQLSAVYSELLAQATELAAENEKLRAKLGWRAYDA